MNFLKGHALEGLATRVQCAQDLCDLARGALHHGEEHADVVSAKTGIPPVVTQLFELAVDQAEHRLGIVKDFGDA
jgi:hypothetical protein